MSTLSPLHRARAAHRPTLPAVLAEQGAHVKTVEGETPLPETDRNELNKLFSHTYGLPIVTFAPGQAANAGPMTIGVVLSGGQAPGGHNVNAGLFDGLKSLNPKNRLIGFLGGPAGPMKGKFQELDADTIDAYRNTGGFDMIGSGRDKIEKPEDMATVRATCQKLGVDTLIIIGGDDSNTNACVLAEHFWGDIKVIGCPKTIDGDLKNQSVEASFGFDTACKVYSELISNIERDALSAKKYYHFIKLMGRSASHIALECALQTHPNYCIISEEVAAKRQTLASITREIATVIANRAKAGKNFGVVLIPEGLLEFIPEMKQLIGELNDLLHEHEVHFKTLTSDDDRLQFVNSHLSLESSRAFSTLPMAIQLQLLADRDPHGNVQVSRIETEKLLIDLVGDLLKEWKSAGTFSGKFSALAHFFGYEGRCAPPTNFDANYCYALGFTAAALAGNGKSGYIASLRGLDKPAAEWLPGGIPLTSMMNIERRKGKEKPVIRKALVELDGKPFQEFAAHREAWTTEDDYVFVGPIQYFGPSDVCDQPTHTLRLEHS